MKIWYQSMASFDNLPVYLRTVQQQLDRFASPGTTVECHGTRAGGLADQYSFMEYFEKLTAMENILKVRRGGYDAMVMGNFLDPGLVGAREMLDVPVFGLGETSMLVACTMGHRFALITPNEKFSHILEENVRRYALTSRLACLDSMEFHIPDLDGTFSDGEAQERARREFTDAARRCIAKGAEVLIPAGGVVMVILEHIGLREVDGVPILNGSAVVLKLAEAAAHLQKVGYRFVSRAGLYGAPTERILTAAGRAFGIDL